MTKVFIPVLNGYMIFDIKTIFFDYQKHSVRFEPIKIPFDPRDKENILFLSCNQQSLTLFTCIVVLISTIRPVHILYILSVYL
jgi:hypothetical protein